MVGLDSRCPVWLNIWAIMLTNSLLASVFLPLKKEADVTPSLGWGGLGGQGQQRLQSMKHSDCQTCRDPTCADCGVAKAEHFVICLNNFWAFSPDPPSSLWFSWGTEALSMPTFRSVIKGTTSPSPKHNFKEWGLLSGEDRVLTWDLAICGEECQKKR